MRRCYVRIYFGSVSGEVCGHFYHCGCFALLQVVRTDAEGSPVQKHPADAADARLQKLQHRPSDFRAPLRVPGVLQ